MSHIESIETEAYQTSDHRLFIDKQEADDHQKDLIGLLLDGFLPHDDRGNVTRIDRHNILMKQLEDPNLFKKISELYHALKHGVKI